MNVHLQREVDRLKKRILTMCAYVDRAIQEAVIALRERDAARAKKVIVGDAEIDRMEVETEEECLKILALYQPVAIDLRYVVAVLKINNDLERIADLAVNIAERAISLASGDKIAFPEELRAMLDKSHEMLKNSLSSLIEMNVETARQVIKDDDLVDELNRKMYALIQKEIRRNPELISSYINLLSISRHLERIADQVTNIAEDVIYMVQGKIVRHAEYT